MSLGKLTTRLRALINRKDFTEELAVGFITDAIADLERVVRFGPMEHIQTAASWEDGRNALIIPSNHIELINLFTDDGELEQVDMAQFLALDDTGGKPTHFVKVADRWLLRPTPASGTRVYLHHYASLAPLYTSDDSNAWTISSVSATLYTAAALAADFYQMEDTYAQRFSSKAAEYVAAINMQALDEAWSGKMNIPLPSNQGDY